MQHLYDFLNSKRLPIYDIMKKYCEVSEKLDGTALQVVSENNHILFFKRSNNICKRSNRELKNIDMLLHADYYNAYLYLQKYEEYFNNFMLLNFEIFSDEKNHLISYNNFKNNIVLLSGFSKAGHVLSLDKLKEIAEYINVSLPDFLWSGNLTDDNITEFLKYKDDQEKIWDYATKIFNLKFNDNIEGLVLTFKDNDNFINRIVKIQNPVFQKNILNHLNDENNKKSINLESIYDDIINNSIFTYNDIYKSVEQRLLSLYMYIEQNEKLCDKIENKLISYDILNDLKINKILIKNIVSTFPDNIKYPHLLKFILLGFMSKRVKEPLWCSLEYQNNKLNTFIEKFIIY